MKSAGCCGSRRRGGLSPVGLSVGPPAATVLSLLIALAQAAGAQPRTTFAVGAVAASFEVDQQGGATYRVPITVAPGAGGLQPSLALVYNSHAGNGSLGSGWTMEGSSAIHRCAGIEPLHGARGRVEMDDADRLCIDGRFLTPVDGVENPLHSRELRTLIESFTKIEVNGDAAANGFTAWTKEGNVVTYGGRADARIEDDGRVFSWLMSRVTDRAGNAMHVHYAEFDDERHVARVDYGTASVAFEYQPRTDASVAYLAGMKFALTKRLGRVVSKAGGRVVREYRLVYAASDGVSPDRLVSVTECAGDGSCLRPTVFRWRETPEFTLSPWGEVLHLGDRAGEHRRYRPGDFNGDGLTDVYEIHGTGGGYDAIQINNGDGSFESVPGPWTDVKKADDLVNFHFADFNGDGLTDVYQFRYRHVRDALYLTRLNQGSLSFEEVPGVDSGTAAAPTVARGCIHRDCLRFGDFNGDGNTDVYRIRHDGATALADEVYLSDGDGAYERVAGVESAADRNESRAVTQVGRIRVGDFNGDGVSDVYRVHDAARSLDSGVGAPDDVYLTVAPGEYRRVNGVETGLNLRNSGDAQLLRVKLGDFNGDGLTDVYYATPGADTSDEVHLSRGDGSYTVVAAPAFPETSGSGGLQLSLSRVRLGDFNGDGKSDLYYLQGGLRPDDVYLAAQDGWRRRDGLVIALGGSDYERIKGVERVHFGDFDGDGVSDVYRVEDARQGTARIYTAPARGNLVESITDGLGFALRIRYAPVSAARVHELAADAAPAASRRPPPLWVVAATSFSNAGPNVGSGVDFGADAGTDFGKGRVERYRYGAARSDPSGFGFLGFAWREVHDVETGLVTRTTYSQRFPHFGSVLQRRTALLHGPTLSLSRTEYDAHLLNDGKTTFVRPTRTESRRYELDGSFTSAVGTSFSDYDEYGNPGRVETITEDQHRRFTRLERHEYFNDPERWLLGRRVRVQVTNGDDSHPDVTRVSMSRYAADTGFLLEQTVHPGEPLAVTRHYEYDDFGNLIVERAEPAAAGAPVVVSRRVYDETGRFVTRTINAEGHAATYVHDERLGRAVLVVDANGLATWRRYDGWGRLIGERRPGGMQTTIVRTYRLPENAPQAAVYAVIEETAGRPLRRVFHDASGRVLRISTLGFDGRALLEDQEYDRLGRTTRISLPRRPDEPVDWVERRYDALDRLVEESSPLVDGAVTTRRFDYRGSAVEHSDELGRPKVITRDALGRIVSVVEPMEAEMSFEYDPVGRLLKARDAHGNETSMEYDAFGNRVRVARPGQGVQRFSYDSFGRVVVAVADGSERRMRYDRLGRLTERTGPEGTARWLYDASEYGVGRLSQESFGGYVRGFRYDDAGRLKAIDDNRGHSVGMVYDKGRLGEIHYPRGVVVERVYNRHGYLSAIRGPFFETGDFSGDSALGEMRTEVFRRGKAEEYERRALFYRRWASRLEATGTDGELSRSLNAAADELESGVVRLREEAPGGASAAYCERTVSVKLVRAGGFLQDAAEASVRLRLQTSGGTHLRRQMYARMALSERLLDEVQRCLSTMRRAPTAVAVVEPVHYWRTLAQDAVGRVSSQLTGDGWRTRFRYHAGNGYLQEIRSDAGGDFPVRHLTYYYDEADNLLSHTDHVRGISEHFGYDELDRLTAAVVLGENEHDDYNKISFYRYDELGNLVSRSGVGVYGYGGAGGPHAATQIGDDAYEYDASGNLIAAPELSAGWFSFGKPEFIETEAGGRLEFAYDANGGRISKRSSDGGVTFYFGKFYEKTLKQDGAIEHRHYIYAGEKLIAVRYEKEDGASVSRRLRYVHHDALGSVAAITDAAGNLVERLSYTPFGERRASDWRRRPDRPPLLVNRGFTGHEHLDEVGLVHMNGRIYDPRTGRFLSPDPYVPSPLAVQSYNRYSYALNNPMKFTDPSGFFLKKVFKGIKRAVKKAVRFVRRNARLIAAVAVGYYAGAWATNTFVESAVSKLVWSPGGMWSGAYMNAYNGALSGGAVLGGAVSGGVSSALSGGGLREVFANAVGAGALRGLGAASGGRWTPQRTLSSAAINGAAAAAAGGSFRDAALSGLQWGGLRYAATVMRRAMITQSLLNPDNAGGLSSGLFGDGFKLGGRRYDVGSDAPGLFGGHQGGAGQVFGASYQPDSLWDRVVEAYAGPHDYLNSFYWYDESGNVRPDLSPFQRQVGQVLSGANVFVATPFAAAALTPDYLHALRL